MVAASKAAIWYGIESKSIRKSREAVSWHGDLKPQVV
jgi:hypothetical protein